MNHRALAGLAGLAAGIVVTVAAAAPASAATATIVVPTDFDPTLSDTRATGHYEVVGTGLHIWTEGSTSTDKVAEYVAAPAPLAVVGEPSLDYAPTTGTIPPGFQLVVDFDNDGAIDGILVGEPVYGGDWWLSNSSAQFVKDGAPSHTGGSGSDNHGTLDAWRAAFPEAQVDFIGFSLGSGVLGDGVLEALNYNGTRYTFAQAVVLAGKQDCKNGGWATSTDPVFRNQGDCVSSFASGR
ncbi:hypothetical protein [Nocardioides taihuensis]|uniref:Cutinase family protein n=1 Tax=Nocardioides taihuensis TaxID=1835606 RepID=A0ABW0BN88_9ACTN